MQPTNSTSSANANHEKSSRRDTKSIFAGVILALLVGANGYVLWSLQQIKTDVAAMNQGFNEEVAAVRENSARQSGLSERSLNELRHELSAALDQANSSVGKAKVEAKRHADQLAKKLSEQQKLQQEQLSDRLTSVTEETQTRFEEFTSDVGAVKTEVESARSELHTAVNNLGQVRGDLGVMSGRIATNADELAYLKTLGEREYVEFDLVKTVTPRRVADIGIQLKDTDRGKNKFTVDVVADDHRIRKKDKSLNEPIQFYVGGRGGQPYEIVVYDVKDNRIIGYLAKPKVEVARR